jgi:hypothetical protein
MQPQNRDRGASAAPDLKYDDVRGKGGGRLLQSNPFAAEHSDGRPKVNASAVQ